MLGIGLHSYGFMDAAFKWLMIFVGSQARHHCPGPPAPALVEEFPAHAPALSSPAPASPAARPSPAT